jgi:hypothetical protein
MPRKIACNYLEKLEAAISAKPVTKTNSLHLCMNKNHEKNLSIFAKKRA